MWFALVLTLLAGLSTSVGGLLAMHRSVLRRDVLAVALGFSAGAMLFVSFMEILPKSHASLVNNFGNARASWFMLASFFGGIALVAIIDKLIPRSINPSDLEGAEELPEGSPLVSRRLMRSGLFVALAIGLHNFPEGFVTFMGALDDPAVGVALAVAIAIHNIPEGIAVAAPLFAATKSRRKAFLYTSLSGLAEPIGALVGYFLLRELFSDTLFGVVFAAVAGMMVFISIDELIPAAKRYETSHHQMVYGLIGGMAVIAVSLVLIK